MGMVFDADMGLADVLKKGKVMLQPGGPLQAFIDITALKGANKYVPRRNGTLAKSAILHTRIGSGMIVWKGPQARLLYHGLIMVDPLYKKGGLTDGERFWSRPGVRKVLTDREFEFDKSRNPLAGARWCDRYTADHLTELAGMVQDKAGALWNK